MLKRRPGKLTSQVLLLSGSVYLVFLLLLSLVQLLFPQRSGPIAFSLVFAPYLVGPLLLLSPLLFVSAKGVGFFRGLLLGCCLIWLLRFPPALNFWPVSNNVDPKVSAITWNIQEGNPRLAVVRQFLMSKPADFIAMQETNGEWLADDQPLKSVYPYQLTVRQGGSSGLVLLSVYPVVSSSFQEGQTARGGVKILWARVDLGNSHLLTVVTAHPYRPDAQGYGCSRLFCFDPLTRDTEIQNIREYLGRVFLPGEPLLLMGDFNTTERDPAYQDLSNGLQDAHRKAGLGWGNAWGLRPAWFAMLRIDYLFSSSNVLPLHTSTDCTPRGSDHCLVYGQFAVK